MPRTRTSLARATSALMCLAFAAGCGREETNDPSRTLLDPQALVEHLVYVDTSRSEAHLLDVGQREPEPAVTTIPLPKNPVATLRRAGAEPELLVLSRGDLDPAAGPAINPALSVVGPSGAGSVSRTYEFRTPFEYIEQSEDGRFAVVFQKPSSGGSGFLSNQYEIAFVDLSVGPSAANPVERNLRGFGELPKRIVFSPPLSLAGREVRLAVVLFGSTLSLIDLEAPADRSEFTIELAPRPDSPQVGLEQVLFDVEENKLYLRGTGSEDVYVVQLTSSTNHMNGFEPSLNQLGAGVAPKDMGIYGSGDARRLLVAAGDRALVIDADSNRITTITLQAPADRVHLFRGRSPFDSKVADRALLYRNGDSSVTFLDLAQIELRPMRSTETLSIRRTYSALRPVGEDRALLTHPGFGLSVLDLLSRTVAPINATVDLSGAIPDPQLNRVWIAPKDQLRVGFLDLATFHPEDVRLDENVRYALPVSGASNPRFVVDHGSSIGKVTLLDAVNPRNLEKAITLEGFLVGGALD